MFDDSVKHQIDLVEIGCAAHARWLERLFSKEPKNLKLTTLSAHIRACLDGQGVAAWPNLIAIKQKVLRRLEAQPSILEIQHWLFIPNRERELPKIKSVPRSVALA
jgi:hypothetical protein